MLSKIGFLLQEYQAPWGWWRPDKNKQSGSFDLRTKFQTTGQTSRNSVEEEKIQTKPNIILWNTFLENRGVIYWTYRLHNSLGKI